MATPFCLSMGYDFGCMIIGVSFQGQAIWWRHSRFRGSKGCCHGNRFWLSICGVHIGATWRIRLNRPCAAAMRPYVKLLWPLVLLELHLRQTLTIRHHNLPMQSRITIMRQSFIHIVSGVSLQRIRDFTRCLRYLIIKINIKTVSLTNSVRAQKSQRENSKNVGCNSCDICTCALTWRALMASRKVWCFTYSANLSPYPRLGFRYKW